jgi:hypothetical protein
MSSRVRFAGLPAAFTRPMHWLLATVCVLATAGTARAQASQTELEVYGFAMLDIGHNFNAINPNWFDTVRVTRLPSFEGEFGEDHSTFAGVRQSRLGVRSSTPTALAVTRPR